MNREQREMNKIRLENIKRGYKDYAFYVLHNEAYYEDYYNEFLELYYIDEEEAMNGFEALMEIKNREQAIYEGIEKCLSALSRTTRDLFIDMIEEYEHEYKHSNSIEVKNIIKDLKHKRSDLYLEYAIKIEEYRMKNDFKAISDFVEVITGQRIEFDF